jgi:hypothetical protein
MMLCQTVHASSRVDYCYLHIDDIQKNASVTCSFFAPPCVDRAQFAPYTGESANPDEKLCDLPLTFR